MHLGLKCMKNDIIKRVDVMWVISGKHCEIYRDPCLKLRCQNGGHCESGGRNTSCVCPPGYMGKHYEYLPYYLY